MTNGSGMPDGAHHLLRSPARRTAVEWDFFQSSAEGLRGHRLPVAVGEKRGRLAGERFGE